jgi:hypothetical protein
LTAPLRTLPDPDPAPPRSAAEGYPFSQNRKNAPQGRGALKALSDHVNIHPKQLVRRRSSGFENLHSLRAVLNRIAVFLYAIPEFIGPVPVFFIPRLLALVHQGLDH